MKDELLANKNELCWRVKHMRGRMQNNGINIMFLLNTLIRNAN